MKKIFLSILISIFASSTFCQIVFEKAYFIDNEGKKTECLIKDMDWANNPSGFEFKLTETDAPVQMDINSVKEFMIYNICRYIRADVQIDQSNTINLPTNYVKDPQWKEQRVFLKVLIDGRAKLLYFQDGTVTRFFLSVDDGQPVQLISREYYYDDPALGRKTLQDKRFREQLSKALICGEIATSDFNTLEYDMGSLESIFRKYYKCAGEPFHEPDQTVRRDALNFRITPGLGLSMLKVFNKESSGEIKNETTYKPATSFRLGAELEYILPFHKNKWGVVLEPAFLYYNSKESDVVQAIFIDYQVGIRHYMFLNNDIKIHLNGLMSTYITDLNSVIWQWDVKPHAGFSLGAGVNYGKFSGELRYYIRRNLLDVFFWYANYSSVNLVAGFQLF